MLGSLPFINRVYPDKAWPFILETLDQVTEEPLIVSNASVSLYRQTHDGGHTTNTEIIPRTSDDITIEPGKVVYIIPKTQTAIEGNYVLIWEVDIDDQRYTTHESRFNVVSGPKWSVQEGYFLDILRTFLKDNHPELYRTDPQVPRWDDDELYVLLLRSVWDINAFPPATSFEMDNLPSEFWDLLLLGGQIFALLGQGTLEIGRDFSYNDNGLAVNLDRSGKFISIAQMLLSHYLSLKVKIKKSYAMAHTHWVGIKEMRMPISIRRPLSMLPHMANVFGRDATYL